MCVFVCVCGLLNWFVLFYCRLPPSTPTGFVFFTLYLHQTDSRHCCSISNNHSSSSSSRLYYWLYLKLGLSHPDNVVGIWISLPCLRLTPAMTGEYECTGAPPRALACAPGITTKTWPASTSLCITEDKIKEACCKCVLNSFIAVVLSPYIYRHSKMSRYIGFIFFPEVPYATIPLPQSVFKTRCCAADSGLSKIRPRY